MAPLSESLLPVGGQPVPATRRQGTAFAVTTVGSAVVISSLIMFFAAAEFGRQTPHEQGAFPVSLSASNLTGHGNLTSLWAPSLTSACYGITGGTCHVTGCSASRNAVCQQGLCVCPPGTCSGADGACHSFPNVPVLRGFTLTNLKYGSKLYMPRVSVFNQMKVTSMLVGLLGVADTFDLFLLPGTMYGHKDYLLVSTRYPDYVATTRATTGTAFTLLGVYDEPLDRELSAFALAVRICKKVDGTMMIGHSGPIVTSWFYVHHGSYEVYGWQLTSDPGRSGYWAPSVPIPGLDACPY